ncbi:MAG: Rpn family recombination-promoting nuclease/putative transposase, partial [Lachnospiraceae bacterium]|nr:Rpn family recombination-promoting nuclease/putative transposase [Lachnospiraceae bacterium]
MDTQEKAAEQEQKTDNLYDKGYKRIFSIKKNFLDFIKKYIGFDWMMELTERDLELIDKEYVTDQFDTYESDLVYRVDTRAGSIYLFFLFELQSYNDFTMPFRLLVYMTAIWLDYFKNSDKNKRKQKRYRLPAIMSIVLHNGERSWTAAHRFREMIGQEELFGKYVVDFEYVLVSVKSLAVSKIKSSNTLIDNILLADKKSTKEEWNSTGIVELVRRVRTMEKSDLNEWIVWFSNVVRELGERERKEFIQQLREGDEKIMCSSFERIMKKEKAEGKAEGKAEAVIELLEDIGEPSEMLREHI